jgi:hypothetical protein
MVFLLLLSPRAAAERDDAHRHMSVATKTGAECYSMFTDDSMCFHPQYNQFVSYPAIIGGHLAYLVIVQGLKMFMANKKDAYNPKAFMLFYNAVQVAFSVTQVVMLAPYLKNYLFNLDGKFDANIEFWVFFHYCTKFCDFFDSFFMVLKKKSEQLSFLHVYHHLTIGVIWGLLLHNGIGNGTAFFGAWINSLVHSLMYFHYLITSLGYNNPFKKYLTLFQMLQFSLCILQAILVFPLDHQFPQPWPVVQLCYHMSLLFLFNQFYKKDRKKDKKKALKK